MIDYKKLVPFKVDCKTIENSIKLQKALFKQGFLWGDGTKNYEEKRYLYAYNYKKGYALTFGQNPSIFNSHRNKEIAIEKLLVSPLKIFLKKKGKKI